MNIFSGKWTLFLCLLALPALAQQKKSDDEVIPYDNDDDAPRNLPSKSDKSPRIREDDEDEAEREKGETLTHLDDPNIGIGFDFLAAAMLLESSRGAGVDPQFGFGFRFTWEFGRLIPDEFLRELFFVDLSYRYARTADGTTQLNADSNHHYFALAPAAGLTLGEKSVFLAYVQAGLGVNASFSNLNVDGKQTQLAGSKFLFQYGIGLRARPALTADGSIRLVFRLELTRMQRGYMSDTWLGGSVGLSF